jgi:hypothetical protein
MYDSFIDALPTKVRSTDWFEEGTRFRKKENALKHRFVELHQLYKKFIALDIDEPATAYRWDERGLPPPSYVMVNPENAHCHYLYELTTPVYYTEQAHRAPQKFYEATDIALTAALDADTCFVGRLVKNPLHPSWRTIRHQVSYELADFQEFGLDLRATKKQVVRESAEGRNTTLFDTLRFWAYATVKSYGAFESFQQAVDSKAISINGHFVGNLNGVLPVKEVLSTAKSVGKWTWKHRHSIAERKNVGVLDLPEELPLKEKQRQGAIYTNLMRTEAIDEKIKQAIYRCKDRGLTLDPGNLEKCGLAGSTFRKHREATNSWIKLLA